MTYLSSDVVRNDFAAAMSDMYQTEVPAYGALLDLVAEANERVLSNRPDIYQQLENTRNLDRIAEERHGAIRLGKASELFTMRRLFAIMGMHPVAYYDLSIAGIPVHSTAFRPIEKRALSANPFRVFTSLLRTELIEDNELRRQAERVLASRNIFSDELMALMTVAERQSGLSASQTTEFIEKAVDVFRWHDEALIDEALYEQLHSSHRLIADVVSFKGPHINHLTPATLDIDFVQAAMPQRNITPKAVVEGPPKRDCPILLRQTSFKALKEVVKFPDKSGVLVAGSHTARFGEIEQRGIALTPTGQALYDRLLNSTREQITPKADGSNAQQYEQILLQTFAEFPDTYTELRKADLAYFSYSVRDATVGQVTGKGKSLEQLIELQLVSFDPIIYEDFLPVSAAGIFQSNLGNDDAAAFKQESNQTEFERALGATVVDRFKLYQQQQEQSIQACLEFFA